MKPWPRPHLALRRKIQKLDDLEARFVRLMRRPANAMILNVVAAVRHQTPTDLITVPQNIRDALAERLADMMRAAVREGAFEGKRDVFRARARVRRPALFADWDDDGPGEPSPESIPYEGILNYEQQALQLADVVEQDILDRTRDVIIASRISGWGTEETIYELMDVLPPHTWRRLENIARTECAKVYEQGKYIIYTQTPGVVGYEIHAVIDSRTTEICVARDGRILPITAAPHEWPPYHYQCRTTVAAVLDIDIESGDVAYNPIPAAAPPPMPGFGTVKITGVPRLV